ncbi:ribosomal maturation YjgA family protein [Tenacibaculum sp. M341]|uniref:ribosomal maturation YjgA family protein n=1 Tax=Tenacibaculum sp. M341 TaxID=2530339 RepID=UPI00104F5E6E|nr:DUF2809 domain-containing protein [Tenacibaculum sp. M341]TCI85300.1 DUF2809 domain-containing protein [Tenacibaculum sp. M341]
MNFRFDKKSFMIAISIFLVEILIAKTSGFLRHTVGDYLVVILLYYLVKSFINAQPKYIAIGVLLFSFTIEIMQAFKLVELLGLEHNRLATIVIGTTFSYGDLIAYTLGVITVYLVEKKFS